MDKKYYDLIISLIKKHRKYQGLEAILDDIANDVYEHSKVVIGTISNEEVIESYFNKVISTSIITVPKKMNFNTRVRHRIISTVLPDTANIVENTNKTEELPSSEEKATYTKTETEFSIENEQDIQENNLDINIESDDFDEISEIEGELTIEDFDEDNSQNSIEQPQEILEERELESEIAPLEEEEEEEEEEEDFVLPVEPEVNIDKSLVDRMINDSTKATVEEIKENNSNFEALDVLFVTENEVIDNNQDAEFEITEEAISVEDYQTVEENLDNIEESLVDETLPNDENNQNIDNDIENIDELEIEENNLGGEIESLIEEDSIEGQLEELDNEVIDDLGAKDEIVLNIDEGLELQEFSENIVEEFNLEPETDTDSIIENSNEKEENIDKTDNAQFINYSCFSYKPNLEEIDSEDIILSINKIQKDYRDIDIFNICELKFVQKKPISEIVDQTGLNKSTIIEILNDISEAIKE